MEGTAALPAEAFIPPHPHPRSPVVALLRAVAQGEGDLLGLLPAEAYEMPIGPLGYSRRSIVVVNEPKLVRHVLVDPDGIFPKSDLMVNALDPLIGDSIFVSSGGTWQRQRAMMDPALTLMRVNRAFPHMEAGIEAAEAALARDAAAGRLLSLDLMMSHLTADIICRSVFSSGLEGHVAHQVFDAFTFFERSVAQVEIRRLILDRAWTRIPQSAAVLDSCALIRRCLGELLDGHLQAGQSFDDIASAVVAARDGEGRAFTREELIDQLGVLFLAGHETSASALTWVFFLLACRPDLVRRLRAEVQAVCGDGPIGFEHTKRLVFTRNVFRETLRLYPPITFLPRVANEATRLGGYRVRRGALVMVAPWLLHRHRRYWTRPNQFDPDRFLPEREAEMIPGAYIPFGIGPRICAGAAFATVEAVLLIARLFRRFDFHVEQPEAVRPAARLTTRPRRQVMLRVTAA
ncbi:cytochrome P450 [Falsiroseomonas selenitidurans]|uniref:Cytochrome P450 n=1 Tax=Falsiroseomonas selenitidurans TaxID=2716335 RepID=A0ABX1EAW0_9PROT|nr:cytochrome P450 [Falsiroseomonas selenitidurans]NKC33958.1 cytochrome P450 [Falsiroseomonas selenitidurans]